MRPPTPQILDFGGGFWILGILDFGDFGFWGFEILDFGDFGFWGVWILDFGAGIPNPKSKIPNPNFFGQIFWILDFGSLCSNFFMWGPNAPYFGFWRGFWILDFGSWGYRILDFGDFGFWDFGDFGFSIVGILDFGFWDFGDFGFLEQYVADLYVQSLDFGIWGFWIVDFGDWGFWILDFGDLGFWILDWGFWMGTLWQNFGCYIRKEDCARRTGSADLLLSYAYFAHIYVAYIMSHCHISLCHRISCIDDYQCIRKMLNNCLMFSSPFNTKKNEPCPAGSGWCWAFGGRAYMCLQCDVNVGRLRYWSI